jgi:hypothetical protein
VDLPKILAGTMNYNQYIMLLLCRTLEWRDPAKNPRVPRSSNNAVVDLADTVGKPKQYNLNA